MECPNFGCCRTSQFRFCLPDRDTNHDDRHLTVFTIERKGQDKGPVETLLGGNPFSPPSRDREGKLAYSQHSQVQLSSYP